MITPAELNRLMKLAESNQVTKPQAAALNRLLEAVAEGRTITVTKVKHRKKKKKLEEAVLVVPKEESEKAEEE